MSRTRKKLDKYFKNNKIRNKIVIDIKKITDEENINFKSHKSMLFFKVLVLNKINSAREKNKDIYYIPNFSDWDIDIDSLINIKKLIPDSGFNLLCFYDEFEETEEIQSAFGNIDKFDHCQILENY